MSRKEEDPGCQIDNPQFDFFAPIKHSGVRETGTIISTSILVYLVMAIDLSPKGALVGWEFSNLQNLAWAVRMRIMR